jgi:hypothetical protein
VAPVPARGVLVLIGSADISDCGRYRYLLTRRWAAGEVVLFVMLNPSTADAERDDPTLVRCSRRARELGFGGLCVANLFAWRSTDPKVLHSVPDPVGPANDEALQTAAERAAMIVCAWGAGGALHTRGAAVAARLRAIGRPVSHLGLTALGEPRHPLRVSYRTPLTPFDQAHAAVT